MAGKYVTLSFRRPFPLAIILIIPFYPSAVTQVCTKTPWQARRDHSCPVFTREAFTAEKMTRSGRPIFMKLCCNHEALTRHGKATAKACKTTRCVLPRDPFNVYQYPCSTLAKFIVDGQYIGNEETMRDNCQDETTGQWGVAAVCCPPNSMANLLISLYGAELNEFPHSARVQSGNELCGGTVYNKDYVITAGHCVTDKNGMVKSPSDTFVVLGTNIATLDSAKNIFPIKRIIVHEDFSLKRGNPEFMRLTFLPKRIYNDVAVLQLARSIDFAKQPSIKALPLAPANFRAGDYADEVVIIGWGTTDNGLITHHLQKANLKIREDEQCFKGYLGGGPYTNTREFSNQLLCVGGIVNGQFSPVAGRGDSGGPSICRGPDGYAVHCGVTSFGGDGDSCSENVDEMSCRPSAYADVSYFRNWIRKHAGEQQTEGLLKVKLYGDPVPSGQFEHQVHITSHGGPSCGGTLISKNTVVTAGHCVFTDDNRPRWDVTVTTRTGTVVKARIGGIVGSPYFARYSQMEKLNYRKSGKRSFLNAPYVDDIAVIKLEKSVAIAPEKLAKVSENSQITGKNTRAVELSILLGNKLKKRLTRRNFRILNERECQRRLDKFRMMGVDARFDTSKILCGVEEYSGGGICDRESGGGLMCGNGQQQILCGVQSFRLCDMSMPSQFVNVAKYKNLIEGVVKMK